MIDPAKITDFQRNDDQLEELLLFCIAAAGKNADTTARILENLLTYGRTLKANASPFEAINLIDEKDGLLETMKKYGFGCYTLKSKGFKEAANCGLNLKTCSVSDLEKISGIGMKTSRFFVMHSRRDIQAACLDTHILKWLGIFSGYDNIPKQTPSSKKIYLYWETVFLNIAGSLGISPTVLDLKIWNYQRGNAVN